MIILEWIKLNLKKIWWACIFLSFSIYFYCNYSRLSNSPNSIDILITISLIVIIFMPLVNEISAFGMSIKKKIDDTRNELKKDVLNVRHEIMSLALVNNNKNEFHFDMNEVPSEKEINEEKAKLKERMNDEGRKKDQSIVDEIYSELELSDDSLFLFKARLIIEKKLEELCKKYSLKNTNRNRSNISQLVYHGLLSLEAEDKLLKVISICNRGIHGEIIDEDYISYVEVVMEELNNDLLNPPKSEEGKMNGFVVCTRCGYTGASPYNNYCPKCHFTSDEY